MVKEKKITEIKLTLILMLISFGFVIFCGIFLFRINDLTNEAYRSSIEFEEAYKYKISQYDDMNYVKKIHDKCINNFYAYCIAKEVETHYKYINHHGPRPIPELYKYGGDCEAWSVFYKRLLDYAGWKTQYVTIDNHIFVIGETANKYCLFDQLVVNCFTLR